jgi:hypothetical protein
LILLEKKRLEAGTIDETLGCILKSADDLAKVKSEGVDRLLSRSRASITEGSSAEHGR